VGGDLSLIHLALIGLAVLVTASCTSQPRPPAKHAEVVVWHRLGSWSGRGDAQTESFQSDSGALRVRWQTRSTDRDEAERFRLTLQSAISGRPLAVAADERGVGSGEALVPETPRAVYAFVESAAIDWSFTVDEGVVGTVPESPTRK
jgi:outer membrane biogenesis lipoprotein LolB